MMVWAVIGLLIIVINFLSNRIINTNCRYIYSGNILVIVGSLVGMTGRPVIAASIVFFGALLSAYGSILIAKLSRYRDNKID